MTVLFLECLPNGQNPDQQEEGCHSGTHSLCLQLLTLPRSYLECAVGRREKVWKRTVQTPVPRQQCIELYCSWAPSPPSTLPIPPAPDTHTHTLRHLDQTSDLPAHICFLQSPNGTLAPVDGCIWALYKCWLLIGLCCG